MAAIYEGYTSGDAAEVRAAGWTIDELPLREALAAIVDFQLARHRAYLELDEDFYRAHHREFSLASRVGMQAPEERIHALLCRHGDAVRVRDLNHAAFLLGRGISAIVRCMIEEQPEKLTDPRMRDEIVDLAAAYVTAPRSSTSLSGSHAASR